MNTTKSSQTTIQDLEERRSVSNRNRLKRWFFEGIRENKKSEHHQDAWWKVMCLTGVDYFSSLGYQPGIAFLAAGVLSPIATVVLVLLTLLGALPVYCRVAKESPFGQGSISMLEQFLWGWRGKTLVLCLLGFAATDFIITITLSAADAAAHIAQNPLVPDWCQNRMGLTMVLLVMLGGVFMFGFREAIGLSVIIVGVYLALNAVVVGYGVATVPHEIIKVDDWCARLFARHGNPWTMVGLSLLLFPKLALGMSGFETGVAVMPLVKGESGDTHENPQGRIRNTKKLLITAAIVMSIFLLTTTFLTTVLIPEPEFAANGKANGRAISYLAHMFFGPGFGCVYDICSILILWFAGASAMTGLLNLVPRYLPRFGMAPEWARATRPLVAFFIGVGFLVTWYFKADVDAQGGAYATGVLVLMTSAALACTLSVWKIFPKQRWVFLPIFLVFLYTTIVNCIERPEGLQIASLFIITIFSASLISRALRATELRVQKIVLDPTAQGFIDQAVNRAQGQIRILAHRPGGTDYATKEREARDTHSIQTAEGDFIFLEVGLKDASDFMEDCLMVEGETIDGYQVIKCSSPAIPNAIAAILFHLRDYSGANPHAYFGWTEGNPVGYIFKYIFFGEGETAPVTREILRELEQNAARRPIIHVG